MLRLTRIQRAALVVVIALVMGLSAPMGSQAALCPTPLLYTTNGQIVATPKVYVDYWQWHSNDPRTLQPVVEGLLNSIGGTKYFNVPNQYYGTVFGSHYYYTNPSSLLKGTWHDETNAIPSYSCVPNMDGHGCTCSPLTCYLGPTALDIGNEALRAMSAMGVDANDPNTIVMVAGPSDRAVNNSGCAWHQAISNSTYPIVKFVNLPYQNDGSCGLEPDAPSLMSLLVQHELQEVITDPYISVLAGGVSHYTWDNSDNTCEIADECVPRFSDTFGTMQDPIVAQLQSSGSTVSRFKLHPEYSNLGSACVYAQQTTAHTFYTGTDGQIWHQNLYGTSANGWGWSAESNVTFTSSPVAVSWGVNRIDVFALDWYGHLGHKWTNNGGGSIGTDDWGAPPSLYQWRYKPAVASWGTARLDVFMTGLYVLYPNNQDVFYRSWDNGSDSGWSDIGAPPTAISSAPTAVSTVTATSSERIDLFVMSGNQLYHTVSVANGPWATWDSWGTAPGNVVGDPSAASWGFSKTPDNGASSVRLDVFISSQSGQIYHRYSTSGDATTGSWELWTHDSGITFASGVTALGMGDQRILVSVPTTTGHLSQTVWSFGSQPWTNLTTNFAPQYGGTASAMW